MPDGTSTSHALLEKINLEEKMSVSIIDIYIIYVYGFNRLKHVFVYQSSFITHAVIFYA